MSGLKKSTIKLVLKKKVDDWLSTITDESVRALAAKNTIVTGGCIASFLLGEKVNDYDIYFRDKETALAIAKYYVEVFKAAPQKVGTTGLDKSCQPEVREEVRVNSKGVSEDRVIIYMKSAGFASESQTEYKYFETRPDGETDDFVESLSTPDEESPEAAYGELLSDPLKAAEEIVEEFSKPVGKGAPKPKYRPVFMSENAITLSDKVQLVIRFYGEPDKLHENYDYAHAMCFYDHGSQLLELKPEALESLLSKSLIYKGSLYPIASVFRTRKFIARGWRITAGQMLKIMWQASQLDLKDPKVLREQLLGVDQAYMHQLISAIENSPEKVDATYLAKIVDEIFE